MKSTFVNLLFALAVLSATALTISSCRSKKNDAAAKGAAARPKGVVADGFVVTPSVFSNDYTASGSLLANEEVDLHPEVSGRITSINFREGSFVRKGQLLIQLYDADLRAGIQKLEANRALQLSTAARQGELLKIGGIARQDFESTQTTISGINADIAAARATLTKMHILAPFDGTIGLRNVSLGAIVTPSTVVATLQQLNPLKMDFSVPDQYKNTIHTGEEIRFSVDGRNDTLTGRISAIEPGADVTTRTVRIRALIPNPKKQLTPGAFAHVMLPLSTDNRAILIPTQAIIPTTRDKQVALVRGGKVQLVTVKTTIRTNEMIQVTSGLQPGDTILLTALMQVKPNMQVKVRRIVKG